ncbi:MAG: NADH-quinone oxidoreductase subunit NuoD [Ignavibacteria bacterium CG22_combo_CG10-13_8_21_14_all_37_15]|nr:NADH-quinone oxidoreductase subunit D [Ignavibacteria bacterium]OIO21604.1 MAG: NADH dehydrogenase [Ignavibacteria bacterium CG1_02_37_35]PIP77614.1 MAG: NADH-quinone oxidoreductase subunit NuoD [Ignavibacteria bacterium CG22_combo_CG10-13_8_21_14_all_37_15]PIS46236.1 MAG: NADH-quinone oxidoreductase subunit NuoD [Ignavibacteria bacterium CG08_land_8_20_14_0_20_37_9]PIX93008.1 MAG: NADH-quinone oxidoreductase subunit NuoD [Ignavibacteria bacterium CG_4_10_14_3_um_filter_37_18]PJC59297.1 MAG
MLKTEQMVLNMGPQHPSTHGVLRLELELEGEIIVNVKPHLGYLHRCFEKHCEAMTYPQIIPYVDRLDYLASMNNEMGYAVAVERLLDIKVPERVEYIRVIMSELQRIASHLVAVGTYGIDIGAFTPFLYCFRDRERILSLFEKTCGARLLYNYIWIGGLSHDLPLNFVNETKDFLKDFKKTIVEINDLLSYNKIFIERTANVGVLNLESAINYGITGPNLRASGLKWDIRRDDPYSIYDRFDFEIPVGKGLHGQVGDCWDRYFLRVQEMEQSIRIIEQALDQLPEGEITSALPKRVKPPEGQIYSRVENPKGELGFFIVSKGQLQPFRVKVRPPSFINLSVLGELCKGHLIADVVAILGSIDIVLGEVDR